jgi:hypothetical protein
MESDAAINSVVAGNTSVLQDPVHENVSIFRRLSQASFVGQSNKPMKEAELKAKTKSEANKPIHEPDPNSAGIDMGAKEIWVAVPPDRAQNSVRKFDAFTRDLVAIVQWLVQCGVRSVAMEATGVYWIPLFQLLEDAG